MYYLYNGTDFLRCRTKISLVSLWRYRSNVCDMVQMSVREIQ